MKTTVRYTSASYGNTTPATSYKIKVRSMRLSSDQWSVKLDVEYGEPQSGIGAYSQNVVEGFGCELSRKEAEVLGRLLLIASSEHFSMQCEVSVESLANAKTPV